MELNSANKRTLVIVNEYKNNIDQILTPEQKNKYCTIFRGEVVDEFNTEEEFLNKIKTDDFYTYVQVAYYIPERDEEEKKVAMP